MSLYQHSNYYHSRPNIHELDEMMIEGGLHPKQRKLPRVTNIGPQDPALIAGENNPALQRLSEEYSQRLSDETIDFLGDLAIKEFEIEDIIEDTFARYPRLRDLGFDIDR